jgi:hypothetical protein
MSRRLESAQGEARPELIVYEEHHYLDADGLEKVLGGLGIDDGPKKVVHYFKEDREGEASYRPLEVTELQEMTGKVAVILNQIADAGAFMADEPNYFTVGLVIETTDSKQVAIQFLGEDCELIDDVLVEDGKDVTKEREFEFYAEYEVAVCSDYTQLLWGDGSFPTH